MYYNLLTCAFTEEKCLGKDPCFVQGKPFNQFECEENGCCFMKNDSKDENLCYKPKTNWKGECREKILNTIYTGWLAKNKQDNRKSAHEYSDQMMYCFGDRRNCPCKIIQSL